MKAYISDHRKQHSLLLARGAPGYSNQLLHEYSREKTDKYKEVDIDLDRYTRALDVIDVMYQSLRMVLNVKDTYSSVSDRIGNYKTMLKTFHEKILKHGDTEPSDALILTISEKAVRDIADGGEHLCKSVSNLMLYTTNVAACSTSDLLVVLESMNRSLGSIEQHLNRAYIETRKYIQVRIGYWKSRICRERTEQEVIDGASGRWCNAERLDY